MTTVVLISALRCARSGMSPTTESRALLLEDPAIAHHVVPFKKKNCIVNQILIWVENVQCLKVLRPTNPHDGQSQLVWIRGNPGKEKPTLLCRIFNESEKLLSENIYLFYFFLSSYRSTHQHCHSCITQTNLSPCQPIRPRRQEVFHVRRFLRHSICHLQRGTPTSRSETDLSRY